MIYATLKPIRQWHNAHTAPDYPLYAIFSGALLFAMVRTLVLGGPGFIASAAAATSTVLALMAKCAYWRHIDSQAPLATLAAAIGLPKHRAARALDAPHFAENFILREMGFAIARRREAAPSRTCRRVRIAASPERPRQSQACPQNDDHTCATMRRYWQSGADDFNRGTAL